MIESFERVKGPQSEQARPVSPASCPLIGDAELAPGGGQGAPPRTPASRRLWSRPALQRLALASPRRSIRWQPRSHHRPRSGRRRSARLPGGHRVCERSRPRFLQLKPPSASTDSTELVHRPGEEPRARRNRILAARDQLEIGFWLSDRRFEVSFDSLSMSEPSRPRCRTQVRPASCVNTTGPRGLVPFVQRREPYPSYHDFPAAAQRAAIPRASTTVTTSVTAPASAASNYGGLGSPVFISSYRFGEGAKSRDFALTQALRAPRALVQSLRGACGWRCCMGRQACLRKPVDQNRRHLLRCFEVWNVRRRIENCNRGSWRQAPRE